MRLTVLGCGPAAPQPDTPASGLLLDSANATVLLDCGSGVAGRLRAIRDPRSLTAVVISHMHADHSLDLGILRYSFAWPGVEDKLPVFLPPGGLAKLDMLATVISERPRFFHDAFAVSEYDPDAVLQIADLSFAFTRSRHYVPSWAMEITDQGGTRLVYSSDTGPNPRLDEIAAGADLLVCEATLQDASEDDLERGHMTPEEAIEMGRRARAGLTVLTHFGSHRRATLIDKARASGLAVVVATAGLEIDFDRRTRNVDAMRSPEAREARAHSLINGAEPGAPELPERHDGPPGRAQTAAPGEPRPDVAKPISRSSQPGS